MSWKLEKEGRHEESPVLEEGRRKHAKVGKEANGIIMAQTKARQDAVITWTFLAFSMVLLLMGISLIVVTQVGSLDVNVWRIGIIVLSILMIGISVAYYFRYRNSGSSRPRDALKKIAQGLDSRSMKRYNTPILFYL
jgi:hypothetical protein